jgi:hypothetical protein
MSDSDVPSHHVRKALIGWWVGGYWCPTKRIRDHWLRKLTIAAMPVLVAEARAMVDDIQQGRTASIDEVIDDLESPRKEMSEHTGQRYTRWFIDYPSTHILAGKAVEVMPVAVHQELLDQHAPCVECMNEREAAEDEAKRLRAVMTTCADKLEQFGNEEPAEVARALRRMQEPPHRKETE